MKLRPQLIGGAFVIGAWLVGAASSLAAPSGISPAEGARGNPSVLDQDWRYCENDDDLFGREKQIKGCTDIIESGRESDANLSIAHFNRAYAHYKRNESAEAIKDYTEALRYDPESGEALGNRALVYQNQGEHQKAMADYNRALSIRPHQIDFNNRGNLYAELKNYERAIADYSAAIKLAPNYGLAWRNRGDAYYDQENFKFALADYNQAIKLEPGDAYALNMRGMVRAEMKEFELAIADYNEAIKREPDSPAGYYNRGLAYWDMEDYAKSVEDYTQVIRISPGDGDAYTNRGLAYAMQEDYRSAIADYDRALAIRVTADDYDNRSIAYLELGDYKKAIADSDAALRIEPANLAYLNQNCWVRARANVELAKARGACDEAVRLDPSDGNTFDSRALVGWKQGRYQDAWSDWNAAYQLDPYEGYLYARGIAAKRLGRSEESRADIERAKRTDPSVVEIYADYGVRP